MRESEAFVYNTPMVVIPFAFDQHINAKNIDVMRLGKHLDYKYVSKELLKEIVMDVLRSPSIKESYQEIQEWKKSTWESRRSKNNYRIL